MIDQTTPPQRIEQLEADINELKNVLGEIQVVQTQILENDKKLFEIHEHNDKWLQQVSDRLDQIEKDSSCQ